MRLDLQQLILAYLFGSVGFLVVVPCLVAMDDSDNLKSFWKNFSAFYTDGESTIFLVMGLLPPGSFAGFFSWGIAAVALPCAVLYGIVWTLTHPYKAFDAIKNKKYLRYAALGLPLLCLGLLWYF